MAWTCFDTSNPPWCDWRILPELEPTLRDIGSTMPVVIDHLAEFDATLDANDPRFQVLLRLVGDGLCWAKLSGAYRCSRPHPDYPDVQPLQEALVCANPERLVWGSDWPHPQIPASRMPNDGRLLNLFLNWITDESLREMILALNPERLYGFKPAVAIALSLAERRELQSLARHGEQGDLP